MLIVNDEIHTAQTMQTEIDWKKYGIDSCLVAFDAERARKMIDQERIDLLLCDIEMPGESGLDLLHWVREKKFDIECIFLTCHASFAYAQKAIEMGCTEYILIPEKYEIIGEKVASAVQKIMERRSAARYQELGKYAAKEIIVQAEEDKTDSKLTPKQLTDKVCIYIVGHLADSGLSVDGIAAEMHFHPVYMNRIFRKCKGRSISQYILERRMTMAADLLTMSSLTANDIAEKVGYAHYNNFFTMFKKYYGMSPIQYQEAHIKV